MTKEFLLKFINHERLSIEDVSTFIVDYCKLCGKREPTAEEIPVLLQLIQAGAFDLNYAIEQASLKLNLCIVRIINKNGQVISQYIE